MLFGIVSCNSNGLLPLADYRDAFEGEFYGVRTNSSWTMGQPTSTETKQDTIVVVAIGDSSVMINGTEIQIDTEGYGFLQGQSSVSSYFSVSFFAGDSIETNMNGGGLSGGYHSNFIGKRH
jgi:hypothetical protein